MAFLRLLLNGLSVEELIWVLDGSKHKINVRNSLYIVQEDQNVVDFISCLPWASIDFSILACTNCPH